MRDLQLRTSNGKWVPVGKSLFGLTIGRVWVSYPLTAKWVLLASPPGPQSIVAEVLSAGSWVWPRSRDPQAITIIAHVNSHVRNRALWHHVIWFQGHVPKFAFISLLAILYKLPTKSRIHRVNIPNKLCVFCVETNESHIFFSCSTTAAIWANLLQKIQLSQNLGGWAIELEVALS